MVDFELMKDKGVLVVRPDGPLRSDDFRRIAQAVDPFILANGRLNGLMIEAPAFPGWESFEAFLDHLRFVRDHQRNIERIAVATDSALLGLAPRIAEHFAHPEFRVFGGGEIDRALAWLASGA
jgi:hypothetical protein